MIDCLGNDRKVSLGITIDLDILQEVYPMHPSTGRGLYKVLNRHDNLCYALKVFDLNLNDGASIKREMLGLNKQLQRPDLFPRFRCYAERQGHGFLLMDWMEGKTFRKAFGDDGTNGTADLKFRMEALKALCEAIGQIHTVKSLHRDIKPDNVLLRNPRDARLIAVIDFGMTAKRREDEEGTRGFQAPEQRWDRSLNLSSTTDIFALGAIGWWLIAGETPRLVPNDECTDWRATSFPSLRDRTPFVPERLEKVLSRAMSYDPRKRQPSTSTLRSEIHNACNG